MPSSPFHGSRRTRNIFRNKESRGVKFHVHHTAIRSFLIRVYLTEWHWIIVVLRRSFKVQLVGSTVRMSRTDEF
jgi:hypothetical protein